MPQIDKFLKMAADLGASDLHIAAGSPPVIRHNGLLKKAKFRELTAKDTKALILEMLTEEQRKQFQETKELDLSYRLEGVGRFRTSVFQQRRGIDAAFRVVSDAPPTLDELGFPDIVKKLLHYRQGLILVTGRAGCGKTTTLSAMVDHLNANRREHIVTIEDPIEIELKPKLAHVVQREVGTHTESFHRALRAALREDPDIIMVGEMRDLETIQLTITAAETGHLVLATLHTTSAARTIDRILDVFPPDQQAQIRTMVADSLRGVITQQLLPTADGKGRVLGLEILLVTPAVANLIRDGKTYQVPQAMQTGSRLGMQLMDDHLLRLVEEFKITHDTAITRASDPSKFPTLEQMHENMLCWDDFVQQNEKLQLKDTADRPCVEFDKKTKEYVIHRERIPFVFFSRGTTLQVDEVVAVLDRLYSGMGQKKKGWL